MREGTEGLAVKKFHSFIPELLNLLVYAADADSVILFSPPLCISRSMVSVLPPKSKVCFPHQPLSSINAPNTGSFIDFFLHMCHFIYWLLLLFYVWRFASMCFNIWFHHVKWTSYKLLFFYTMISFVRKQIFASMDDQQIILKRIGQALFFKAA